MGATVFEIAGGGGGVGLCVPKGLEKEGLIFPVVNVICFSLLDHKLLRFSPLLDHVTEITCHLLKSVQLDFEEGNFGSGFGIELLLSFAIAR